MRTTTMKSLHLIPLATTAVLLASCTHASAPPAITSTPSTTGAEASHLEVLRAGSRPAMAGPPANFTGRAVVTPLFSPTPHTRAAGASVTFDPGARSAWHSHPAGQTLIITEGAGWVQEWGRERVELRVGDVVWTPPGVKHWHGATQTAGMTHIAIQEAVNGSVVTWMEHVSDAQYESGSATP